MTINRKKEIKKILLVGLGNLGSNYIKAIFSLPFKIELYIFDKNSDQLNKKLFPPVNIKIIKLKNLSKLNTNLELVIVASTANKRLELIQKLKKNKVRFWILEKLLEQNIVSLNKIYKKLKLSNCWINIPRRTMPEYKFIKKNYNFDIPCELKLGMNGDRIVTNAIHFIDLLCWFSNSKMNSIDISKLKPSWVKSKREGFYETGGILKIILKNKSKIILKAGNKTKKTDISINNKEMSWKISETKLIAIRSDGLKIKIKLPLVSPIDEKNNEGYNS